MDLLALHFARHALAAQAKVNPHLLPALSAVDAEIAATPVPPHADHGAMAAALAGHARSSHWETARKRYLVKNPVCCISGETEELEVHHVETFERARICGRHDLELDERYLVTVTRKPGNDLHLMLHLLNFQSIDMSYRNDIHLWAGKTEAEIRADSAFQAAVASRPVPAHEMTQGQIRQQRMRLDQLYPVDDSPTGPSILWPDCAPTPCP